MGGLIDSVNRTISETCLWCHAHPGKWHAWPIAYSSERAARETQNQPTDRTQALADWKPNLDHHDLAYDLKLDVDYEASKFRDRLLANAAIPATIDAAFDLWLKRGAELGLGGRETPKVKTCQHTWACRHTQAILDRVGISHDDDTAGRVAQRLKRGDDPEAIVDDLLELRDHEWWEAA